MLIMEKVIKKTGNRWSKILHIEIVNPIGWESQNDYNTLYITKEEFCNRAANSVVAPQLKSLSRRDAAKYAKKKLK
jgi:hypothetical protein